MRHFVLALVLVLSACGTPPAKAPNSGTGSNNVTANNTTGQNSVTMTTAGRNVWADDYDRSCDFDGECIVVQEGDACLCGGSACGNAGINSSDGEQWSSDRDGICPDGEEICSRAACPEILPVCASGQCDSRFPIYVDPTLIDKSCEVDEECTIVVGGEICSACRCGGTAVNAAAAAEYLSGLGSADCTPGPDFCDCPSLASAWCNDGTCAEGVAP